MTIAPKAPCNWPGCDTLVQRPEGWCPKHKKDKESEIDQERKTRLRLHDARRASSHARGYDRNWQRLRKRVIREEPDCRVCGRVAIDVDHIIPLAQGGTNARDNLQALCKSCHAKKTIREVAEAGKSAGELELNRLLGYDGPESEGE